MLDNSCDTEVGNIEEKTGVTSLEGERKSVVDVNKVIESVISNCCDENFSDDVTENITVFIYDCVVRITKSSLMVSTGDEEGSNVIKDITSLMSDSLSKSVSEESSIGGSTITWRLSLRD